MDPWSNDTHRFDDELIIDEDMFDLLIDTDFDLDEVRAILAEAEADKSTTAVSSSSSSSGANNFAANDCIPDEEMSLGSIDVDFLESLDEVDNEMVNLSVPSTHHAENETDCITSTSSLTDEFESIVPSTPEPKKQITTKKNKKRKSTQCPSSSGRVDSQLVKMPKGLSRDVRRTYANMWANVANSHESDMLRGFLDQFCCHNTAVSIYSPNGPLEMKVTGQYDIFRMMVAQTVMAPDGCSRLHDVKIHTSSKENGRCRIVANLRAISTQICQLDPKDYMPLSLFGSEEEIPDLCEVAASTHCAVEMEGVNANQSDKHRRMLLGDKPKYPQSKAAGHAIIDEMDSFNDAFQKMKIKAVPLEEPVTSYCNVTLTLHVNEDKFIDEWSFHMKRCDPIAAL